MGRSYDVASLIRSTKVLVVDDEPYMRKVIRSLLLSSGVRNIEEVSDGMAGIEAIANVVPDVVFLDWEMPLLNGPEFVRMVRSPGAFPHPDVPIVMLTGHVERDRVIEAIQLGVNEYICKPVSAKTLIDRIIAIRTQPRAIVKLGNYYGPAPRKVLTEAVRKARAPHDDLAWVE